MGNKKVKNAVSKTYNNITFRSKLEVSCYKRLEASGLSFSYEPERINLWEGEKIYNVPVFEQKKGVKLMQSLPNPFKLRNMTYTPDFKVVYKGTIIYIDSKGFATDMYMLKRKMFIQHLEQKDDDYNYTFLEPRNLTHMDQAIDIIKKL